MSYFSTNLKYLRDLKGLSQEDLSEEFKCTRARISSYETGRNEPPLDLLIDMSNYFELPVDTLIRYDLRKSKNQSFIKIGNNRVLFPITVNNENEELIEIVPEKATAGYLQGYSDPEYIESLPKVIWPFSEPGSHRGFPIIGDSMYPIRSGSYVLGKYIERVSDINEGKTYIVVTKDGFTYKRLYRSADSNNRLLLVPDNKKFSQFEIDVHDVLELWEFRGNMILEEYSVSEIKRSNIVEAARDLQMELQSINGDEN